MGIKDYFSKEQKTENILRAEAQAEEKRKTPSVFRGPGLYENDLNLLTSKLAEIQNLLVTGSLSTIDSNFDKITKAVGMLADIIQNRSAESENNPPLKKLVPAGSSLSDSFNSNFVKKDLLAEIKNIVNDLDTRLKNRFSGIETLLGTSGETKYNPPPLTNKNKFNSGRKPLTEQEFLRRCEEIKKFFEPHLHFVEKSWELKECRENVILWKITEKGEAGNIPQETFLAALVCNSEFDKKREKTVLTELRNRLVKVFGGEKEEHQKTNCVILTSFEFRAETKTLNEWYASRVGVFQLEAVFYLLPLWRVLKNNFGLAIAGQTEMTVVSTSEESAANSITTGFHTESAGNLKETAVESKIKADEDSSASEDSSSVGEISGKQPENSDKPADVSLLYVENESGSASEVIVKGDSDIEEETAQEGEAETEQEENYRYAPDE